MACAAYCVSSCCMLVHLVGDRVADAYHPHAPIQHAQVLPSRCPLVWRSSTSRYRVVRGTWSASTSGAHMLPTHRPAYVSVTGWVCRHPEPDVQQHPAVDSRQTSAGDCCHSTNRNHVCAEYTRCTALWTGNMLSRVTCLPQQKRMCRHSLRYPDVSEVMIPKPGNLCLSSSLSSSAEGLLQQQLMVFVLVACHCS